MSPRRVSAFELSRLAVPLPAFLPSVNQIGFDGYDMLAAPVRISPPGPDGEGTLTAWVIAAKRRADGTLVPDPAGNFLFPLSGRYRQDSVILSADNIELTFSFGPVPLRLLQFRGQLGKDLAFRPGASLYAEVNCPEVPNYGPFLPMFRLCNSDGQLIGSGTFLTRRYGAGREAANVRPAGVSVRSIDLTRPSLTRAGSASAELGVAAGTRYRPRDHTVGLLLTDTATGEPVGLDYRRATRVTADAAGNVTGVRVEIPAGVRLPDRVTAHVMTDVFPLASRDL
jgi:hypothetical protein